MTFVFGFIVGNTIGAIDPAAVLPFAYASLAVGLAMIAGLVLCLWVLRRK